MMNKTDLDKRIEEKLAKFSMKDGAFLSTWNEKTGDYTVSFEGHDLQRGISALITEALVDCLSNSSQNKELTELKKEFEKIWINEHGYANFCCESFKHGHEDDMERVWNFFLPHLKSNDEIKREAVESKAGQDFITALASERHTRDFVEFAKKHFMKDTDDFLTDGECAEMDIVLSRYLTQQSLDKEIKENNE